MKITITLFILYFSLSSYSQSFYDVKSVEDIHLYFYEGDWNAKLNQLKKGNSKERILAKLVYKDQTIDSVGIRYKGNSSYSSYHNKNPFNIKLNYTQKAANIQGYKKLKLSNIFRDPSAIREVLAYQILNNHVSSSKANFINLYINDTLVGLYNNVEPVDKAFLERQFGSNKNTFYKCENSNPNLPQNCKTHVAGGLTLGFTTDSACYVNEYELKSEKGWTDLLDLMYALWYNSDSTSQYYQSIEAHIDVDQVMWMLAFNNLFVNLDSYSWSGRNYYLYQNSEEVFQIIPWDFNQCFGSFSHFYDSKNLAQFPLYMSIEEPTKPLISKLLNNEKYKSLYLKHYRTLIDEYLISGKLEQMAKDLQKTIEASIENDPWFYYAYSAYKESLYSSTKGSVPGILELMEKRLQYLKQYPELKLD